MASLSVEEENYVRMSLLTSGISPRAARIFFDSEFAPACLDASLKKEYNKLLDLKTKHRINQSQWNLLFPRFPDIVMSDTFDINLIITLLRNLSTINPPVRGFDCLPTANETTQGSDLARIRYYKNYLAHVGDGKLDTTFFITAWEDLSGAIGRLGGQTLKNECDQLKVKPLDQTNKEIIMDINHSKNEMAEMKQTVESLSKEVLNLKSISNLKSIQKETSPWNVGDRLQHLKRIKSSSEFRILLSKGTYASYENRVYLAGSVMTGKSTLASVLIGENIPTDWRSTDGLIIHFGRNGIDLEKRKMVPLKKGSAGHDVFAKLLRGKPEIKHLKSMKQNEPSSSESSVDDTEFIYNRNSSIDDSNETTEEESNGLEVMIHDDMLKEILEGNYKMNIAPSDLVDFGGQKSFDMTHQLFIQCKGTFVLMFDGRYGLCDALDAYKPNVVTTAGILTHWIDSILTYCVDDSVDEQIKLPKILFAATHGDSFTQNELDDRKAMFTEELTKIFSSNDLHEHIIYNTLFFFDARKKDDPEIQLLTTHLVDIAFEQPSWGQQMPVAWVPLELQISKMKAARMNFVTKSQLQGFNVQNGDFILTDPQFEDFLKVQHSLGKLLYFGEYGIGKYIIIQPSALVNVLRSFVTDKIFWPKGKNNTNILPDLCKTGMIKRQDLYKLWEQKTFKQILPTEDLRKFLIEVLIHLDILVEPKCYSGADESGDFFLVPCMIKEEAPSSFFPTQQKEEKTICLSYRLKKSSVPAALIFKLIGSALNILPIKETEGRPCLYYKAAAFYVDDDNECRIHMDGNRIIIALINKISALEISPDIAASIQECLTLTLTKVLHFYYTCMGKDIKQIDILKLFDTDVGVPCCKGFCFIPVNEAMKKKTWICENNKDHTTDLLVYWILDESIGTAECPLNCDGIPTEVKLESPNEKHLVRLASVLDITIFHDFFLHLGMETTDWHNIQYVYWQPVDAMFMALMKWRDTDSQVTFQKILGAQKNIQDNQHHLCKVLSEHTGLPEIAGFGFEGTPSDSFLSTLPKKLGNCVLPLGIELGLRITDIEAVFVRYPRDLFSQVYEVLKIWKQKTQENTYSNLMFAIQRVRGKQFLERNFGCDN